VSNARGLIVSSMTKCSLPLSGLGSLQSGESDPDAVPGFAMKKSARQCDWNACLAYLCGAEAEIACLARSRLGRAELLCLRCVI